jgi:hypothetical protein
MVRESLFQKISFADLEESLQNIKKSEVKRVSDIQSPKAKMAWAKITDIPKVAQLRDIQNNFEIEKPKTDSVLEEISDSQISKLAPEVERTQNEAESKQQEKRQADQELGQPMAGGLKLESPPKLELRPKLASVGDDLENTFEKTVQLAKSKILNTQVNTVEPVSESRGVNNQKDPSEEDSSDHSSGGVFYGELQVDDSAINWLNSQKGHIELFLNRVGSKDPQDTVFLMDYQFPGSGNQFEFDGTGMKGKYRLVAGVYTPASAVPVAQVMYSKVISSENYKEKIKFEVSHTAISTAPGRSESQRLSETVPLNVTLFDGAPGSYRSPKTLKAGEVTVVGYPELGRFPVDKEGNIRIPSVPVASELLVEARAPGYYPTRQIVPIFSTAAYAPLYLIQKDKVEVVTQFFTKKPQQAEKSVVMGRVYDIKSRSPLAGETLSLSHRKGSAVYFGALPDINQKTTLDTGLFGFYNVEPSIRSIARSIDKHSLLLTLLPDYGYFVELGRGGSRDLVGSLTDPFLRKPVFGSLQLVGDSKEAEATEWGHYFRGSSGRVSHYLVYRSLECSRFHQRKLFLHDGTRFDQRKRKPNC